MIEKKLVSVCIPTYNSEKFLEKTLTSILSQDYKNIEVIIGDNCSNDNTLKIIEKYSAIDKRIRYFKNISNIGYVKNCNKLIENSKGKYIAVYHSDDVYSKKIISKEVEILENNEELAGVFTNHYFIDEHENHLKWKSPLEGNEKLLKVNFDLFLDMVLEKGNFFCCPSSMIKKEVYQELKGYSDKNLYIEDLDMWTRILEKYELGILNEKLMEYRISSQQISNYFRDVKRSEFHIEIKYIENVIKTKGILEKYEKRLNNRKCRDIIDMALFSVKRYDYDNFFRMLNKSKEYSIIEMKNKRGILQNFFSYRVLYLLLICYFKLSKLLHRRR